MSRRSLVAGANALFRMAEAELPAHRRIVFDPYAHLFVERHPVIGVVRYGRFVLPSLARFVDELRTAHCVRHRSIDTLLLDALAAGFTQVVIVGAGYDMRRARFAEVLSAGRVFEVDEPTTAAAKARCLAGAYLPGRAEYTTVDLMRESLAAALEATSFVDSAPTCFVVEGLVHYLSPARFAALLADLGAGSGRRRVLVSFIRSEVYEGASMLLGRTMQAMREIPRLHFTPEALGEAFAAVGLPRLRRWTFAEQVRDFAPEAAGRPVGASQDVVEATR